MSCRQANRGIPMAALALSLVLSACSTQRVTPITKLEEKRICIVQSSHDMGRGAATFAEAYRSALADRGYQPEILPSTAMSWACPVTSRYAAGWNWDGPIRYLGYAELRVYEKGKEIGRARFDARSSRLISAENEIRAMVDELFPR